MQVSRRAPDYSMDIARSFTIDLTKAAGTYDLCTVTGGDILIDNYNVGFYVTTAGATFTSVAVQTNQTNATILLTSTEGAVANIVAQKALVHAIPVDGLILKSGQKIQYTIVGATGTGAILAAFAFMPLTAGATLV